MFHSENPLEKHDHAGPQGMIHAAVRPRLQDLPGLVEIVVEEEVYRLLRLH